MTIPPVVIDAQGLNKRYGVVKALDEVTLQVDGEVFGLVGVNGAGKSTFFRALLHQVELDAGTLTVCGRDVGREGVEARRRIGYLPEEPQLYARLTGWELLTFVAGLKGLDNRAERQELVAELGLEAACHQLMEGYSLGMRKKIALIAALMGAPPLVLLDEPLNGLDTEAMRWLRLRIAAMAAAGTTFMISSHAMAFIERVCARIGVLRQGRLVALGTPEALRAEAGMEAGTPFEDVFLQLAAGCKYSDLAIQQAADSNEK